MLRAIFVVAPGFLSGYLSDDSTNCILKYDMEDFVMKKIRCKHCRRKIDMKQLEGDWQYRFYKCPNCDRENSKRSFLGKAARVGKFVVTPILIILGGGSSE